jgi:hypothetical protein
MPSRPTGTAKPLHEGRPSTALLEAFEEGEQGIVWTITPGRAVCWGCLVECLLFELEAGVEIDLGGLHRLVTKPKAITAQSTPLFRSAIAAEWRRTWGDTRSPSREGHC